LFRLHLFIATGTLDILEIQHLSTYLDYKTLQPALDKINKLAYVCAQPYRSFVLTRHLPDKLQEKRISIVKLGNFENVHAKTNNRRSN